jgi:small acid-soluble spore protein F (minor alpha/beta-type SASP)
MSDRLKYELAQDLGFYDKVKNGDWGNITTRDAGNMVKAAIIRAEKMLAEDNQLPQRQGG